MQKNARIAISLAALIGVSVSGCSGMSDANHGAGSDTLAVEKIEHDIGRISAALNMVSMTSDEAVGMSGNIADELVGNGILIRYPSFEGKPYDLSTATSSANSQKPVAAKDVAFINISEGVGKGACHKLNSRVGVAGIPVLSDASEMSPIERYKLAATVEGQVLGKGWLPKTVCYQVVDSSVGGGAESHYEVSSLVSKKSFFNT